jgi:hypothetical protein
MRALFFLWVAAMGTLKLFWRIVLTSRCTMFMTQRASRTQNFIGFSNLPNNQFDYVYAHGAVFACVPHEQKQQFVDDLAARVVDGGTLYLCMGYAKQCRICRGKVYSIDGHTVTEYVASRGDGWQEIVTHIWGLQKISSVYYTADIGPLWQKHSARITTIT